MPRDEVRERIKQAVADLGLSPREAEVAEKIATGASNDVLLDSLNMKHGTLSTHLRSIFSKLQVHSRAELVSLVAQRALGNAAADLEGKPLRPKVGGDSQAHRQED